MSYQPCTMSPYLGLQRLNMKTYRTVFSLGLSTLLLLGCDIEPKPQVATPSEPETTSTTDSHIRRNPLRNAYFGDLHLHTSNSYDAYLFNIRTTPEDAYQFAKGGTIQHTAGFDIQLKSGPLDFLAVTDHAEYLGVLREVHTPGTPYSEVPYANNLFSSDRKTIFAAFRRFVDSMLTSEVLPEFSDMVATRSAWQQTIEAAERHNQPGHFTTFIGYEYTSLPGMRNLHRNVIFAGDAVPELPFSALDSANPEALWNWLDRLRNDQQIDALAIPHNSNASDGTMFESTMWDGQSITPAYAKLRARNEPLVEIIQIKGQSETTPWLSASDEFADFELMTSYIGDVQKITKFDGGYVRDALKRGLEIENTIGANPYKMGFVAGSDGHNSAGPYEESNNFFKVGALDARPEQRGSVPLAKYADWDAAYADGWKTPLSSTWGSGGLTGIWAESNTRESLFAGLKRKETFATSGPRIRVRMFAGYNLDTADLSTEQGIEQAYRSATPMGGEFNLSSAQAPQFRVLAMRDAHSAPLERIQMVKGWVNADGNTEERVVDIACANNQPIDADTQRCPALTDSVDVSTCAINQRIGNATLQAVWKDPQFSASQNAFYYARVLETPTCRWSTWDALRAGVTPNPRLPMTIQERAYSSPIWINAHAKNNDNAESR